MRFDILDGGRPVDVATGNQCCGFHGTLQDDAGLRFFNSHINGAIQQGFIGNHSFDFNAAGGSNNHLGFGIVDTGRQLVSRKSAKNHGMDRAQSGAGQHGNGRFRDHGHVDQNPVSFCDSTGRQRARKNRNFIPQLQISIFFDGVCDGAVVNQGNLIGPAVFDMIVQRIVTGIDDSARKPAVKRLVRVIQHFIPFFVPKQVFGCFCPEHIRGFYG